MASFQDPGFISWPFTLLENAKNCILEIPQHIFSLFQLDQWRIHWNPEQGTFKTFLTPPSFPENFGSFLLWFKHLFSPDTTHIRKLQMFLGYNGRMDYKSRCFSNLLPLPTFLFEALSPLLLPPFSQLGSICPYLCDPKANLDLYLYCYIF